MFFLGTGIRHRLVEEGSFPCPTCACEQPYVRKLARRYFTFFFIPVMELEDLGEFVQCYVCDGTFDTSVLRRSPGGQRRFVDEVLRAVCAGIAHIAGGGAPLSPDQAAEIAQEVSTRFGGRADVSMLRAELLRRFPDAHELSRAVRPAGPGLEETGKEALLRVGGEAAVTLHGGRLPAQSRETMKEVGEWIGLSTAHIRGLIAEVEEIGRR